MKPLESVKPIRVGLETEPEPLEIDLRRTAVVVIDMTNAFIKKGGFFDLMGVDISLCEKMMDSFVMRRQKGA